VKKEWRKKIGNRGMREGDTYFFEKKGELVTSHL
jgi:hypothetical protein